MAAIAVMEQNMGSFSDRTYQNLPVLSVSESFSALVGFLSARFQAKLAADSGIGLDEYGILSNIEDGSNPDILYGKNEIILVDDEFYATINTASYNKDQTWAFVGEDWFRACWMVHGGCRQELVPQGTVRVPSWVTQPVLTMRPGHTDFELQPDSYIKVERLTAGGPMMWVSIALSRRALQRAFGGMDSAIPRELDAYIFKENSVLLLHRTPISKAGLQIVSSLYDVDLSGKLRVQFLKNQIYSLLYLALGGWDTRHLSSQKNLAYRKMVDGADMLRTLARTSTVVDLTNVATHLGMSRSLFDQYFRATYNVTPGRFLRDEKMQYAFELLTRGKSVAEIAHTLGYEAPSSLVRAFRKWHGVPPGTLRDRMS